MNSRAYANHVADQISKMVADAEAQAEFEELRGLSAATPRHKQRSSIAARRRSKLRPPPHAQLQNQADDGDQVKRCFHPWAAKMGATVKPCEL